MIRSWLLLALMSGWLLFLYLEKKGPMDYLPRTLPETLPEQPDVWNSDRLFFSGWSTAEAQRRWSASKEPKVCFKAIRTPDGSKGIAIVVEADLVEPLVGRLVRVHLNDQTIDYRMTASPRHVFEYRNPASVQDGLFCLRFELPVTARAPGDSRDLGLSFKTLRYRYFSVEANSSDTR